MLRRVLSTSSSTISGGSVTTEASQGERGERSRSEGEKGKRLGREEFGSGGKDKEERDVVERGVDEDVGDAGGER